MSAHREAGFTLVELIVAVTILTIVAAVLGEAAVQGLDVTFATTRSVADAAGSYVLVGDLLDDVRGARTMGTLAGPPCGPAGRLLWTADGDPGDSATTIATYAVKAASATTPNQLVRQTCSGAPPSAPSTPVVVASWSGPANPTIACDSRLDCGGTTTLAGDLSPTGSTLSLSSAVGLPGSPPAYQLTVGALGAPGAEEMTVVGGFGTDALTVSRPDPLPHAAGDPVTFEPASVDVCVPQDGATGQSGPCAAGNLSLAIGRRQS